MAILERGSDLRTFFNTKILEISSPETDHVLLENLYSCFIQHPLQNFEHNGKPQSQTIPSESIPQSQKFSSKRIPQSQNFQAKNYPKLAHIPVSPIVKYPPPPGFKISLSRFVANNSIQCTAMNSAAGLRFCFNQRQRYLPAGDL